LRTERDVMALREALADGTIDIVATDHAPHPPVGCSLLAFPGGACGSPRRANVCCVRRVRTRT
ncbi:hypothetical protein, partial [Streptomyces sp. NPDC002516]